VPKELYFSVLPIRNTRCDFALLIQNHNPMCGIVAYIGTREAYPILIEGLRRLEYRGYDSAGVALLNGGIHVYKRKGKVAELEKHAANGQVKATVGIGHTRWATHGEPDDINAHPHQSG